jgi:hypothetical protein
MAFFRGIKSAKFCSGMAEEIVDEIPILFTTRYLADFCIGVYYHQLSYGLPNGDACSIAHRAETWLGLGMFGERLCTTNLDPHVNLL